MREELALVLKQILPHLVLFMPVDFVHNGAEFVFRDCKELLVV